MVGYVHDPSREMVYVIAKPNKRLKTRNQGCKRSIHAISTAQSAAHPCGEPQSGMCNRVTDQPSNALAEDIADRLLYQTGRGLVSGDYKLCQACFDIPHLIETSDTKRVIRSDDELRQVFDNMQDHYRKNGVKDMARMVLSAEFIDPDTIGSTHVSRLLKADGKIFRKPFPVYSILKRYGTSWKISSSIYAILDSPELCLALETDSPTASHR